MTPVDSVPRYRDLPVSSDGFPHAWDTFGRDDELGRLNLLDAPCRVAAMSELQRGVSFNLTLPLDASEATFSPYRYAYEHHLFEIRRGVLDDYIDGFYLQGSTQWDALRHIKGGDDGYYGGTSAADAGSSGTKLGIDRWAERGIVGRGVLADVEGHERAQGRAFDPVGSTEVSVAMLRETLDAAGVTPRSGDILLLRTGYVEAVQADASVTGLRHPGRDGSADALAEYQANMTGPGLEASEEMAEFLWDSGFVAIAADNPAVEAYPGRRPADWLHRRLIPFLGFALGEFFDFRALAADCWADGRFTCLVVSVPLNLPGGVGSPGNAVAIK